MCNLRPKSLSKSFSRILSFLGKQFQIPNIPFSDCIDCILFLGSQGAFLIPFGLSVELVGSKRKTLVGNMIQVPFAIGESILGLVAYGIRLLEVF